MTLSISKTLAAALCLSTCVWGAASTPTAKSTGWVNVNPDQKGNPKWKKAEELTKIQNFLSGVTADYIQSIKTGIQSWSTVLPTFRNIAAGKAAMQGTGDQAAPKDNSKDYPQTSLIAYLRG